MLVVKKFGGSSVADKERIFNVARRCAEEYQMGNDVIVVLSAMGDTTDELDNRNCLVHFHIQFQLLWFAVVLLF